MFGAFGQNDLLIMMMNTVVGESVDMDAAEKAFVTTRGDFRAKFTAAVEARIAQQAVPEVFIDLPKDAEQLRKPELERLVRPAADGFLRSYPTKDELLDQVTRIRRRQERRPAWIPRIGPDLKPRPIEPAADAAVRVPVRRLVVAALPELGDVTVVLPESWEERPELPMAPGGAGEWECALFALFGLTGEGVSTGPITLDASANEALVPEHVRWWSTEPPRPVPATEDCGVASEMLATVECLGGLPVVDGDPEVVANAVVNAGDWRYSPQWSLKCWAPGETAATTSVTRAAIAGWADEDRSGLLVYVYGGALNDSDGLLGVPVPLHSYLLVATRSPDTDAVESVHRISLSCPGDQWCRRNGCPDTDFFEASALLTHVVTAGHAAEIADAHGTESFQQLYGDGFGADYSDGVLEHLTITLSAGGWTELGTSEWEGGIEESLLRRGEHCVRASYDPVTRQVRLIDGRSELELNLDLLAEDGVLVDDRIDFDAGAEKWDSDLLTAADDLLRGRFSELPQLTSPAQFTVLGLHPRADGTLRGPDAAHIAEQQLRAFAGAVGLLTPGDG